jgi:hypothetical protein
MFVAALKRVTPFTHPVIVSKRFSTGQVECGCATFIILNADGWILTAAHVIADLVAKQAHDRERAEHEAAISAIESQTQLTGKQKKRQIAGLRRDAKKWITNVSYWWGADGLRAEHFVTDQLADLALSRLEPFDPKKVDAFPVFRDPEDEIQQGASLCRLGFPFHEIAATYDEAADIFRLADGTLPVPRFPMDGIYTRGAIFLDEASGRRVEYVETSTPGLRGQSGGPIFDVQGRICGLQTRTHHFALGFSPSVKRDGREVREDQFLNVGLGVHVKEILSLLRANSVAVDIR